MSVDRRVKPRRQPSPGTAETGRNHEPPQHSSTPPETIRPLAAHELDRLQPLWLALHKHHVRTSPRLAGMTARPGHESWAHRRAKYTRWANEPETFVLVAEANHQFIGYAFVTVAPGYSSWDSGERQAQLETLSVAPSMRGQGLGTRLLAAVRDQLASAGIESLVISTACTNSRAHRFYERHGFRRAEVVFVGATVIA